MARPCITLTPDQVREVETLSALLNQNQIADYFGISHTTFKQIIGRDEEVAVRYKRGKAKAIAHVANGLLQKARAGCTTSSIFYLKTQAGWRETAEVTHSASGDAASGDAQDTLRQMLDRIAARPMRIGVEADRQSATLTGREDPDAAG